MKELKITCLVEKIELNPQNALSFSAPMLEIKNEQFQSRNVKRSYRCAGRNRDPKKTLLWYHHILVTVAPML